MKTFSIATLTLVLCMSYSASAQSADPLFNQTVEWSYNSDPGKSLMQALDDLRLAGHDFHVVVAPELKSFANAPCVSGGIKASLQHVITRLADACGMTTEFNLRTVTLRLAGTATQMNRRGQNKSAGIDLTTQADVMPSQVQPAQRAMPQPQMEPAPNTLRRPGLEHQANVTNAVYNYAQGDPLATFQADMVNSGLGCTMLGPLRPAACDYGYRGGYGGYYGSGGGYYPNGRVNGSQPGPVGLGMWQYANCSMPPFNEDRNCTHGDFKIDGGSERLLQQVNIYVDDINRGPASKFNNRFNDALALTTGEHFVQFVWIKDDTIAYEAMTYIESRYVNKGTPNVLKVDDNRFKHEPHRKRINTPRNKDLPVQEVEDVLRTPAPPFKP